jgi:putative lipoic acid-binding regulatory protein
MTDQATLLDFPCAFPIKAMGRNGNDFETVVSEIVFRHARLFAGEQVRARPSGAGNFLSVTITISAESRAQLDRIYQDLTDCEQVLMAL